MVAMEFAARQHAQGGDLPPVTGEDMTDERYKPKSDETHVPRDRGPAPKQICEVDGREIHGIFKNTGVCSEDCKDARDGKVEHPFIMPPHKKLGYTKPVDEVDSMLLEGTDDGVDPGGIR